MSPKRILLIASTAALIGTRAGGEVMCIYSEKANVREDAGTEYPIAWTADRYTPFQILEWNGDWASVNDVDGSGGWVHRSLLSSEPCVVLAGIRANVRSGPGLDQQILWEVEHGYLFKVLETTGEWVRVTDDKEIDGWIFSDLVWGNSGS